MKEARERKEKEEDRVRRLVEARAIEKERSRFRRGGGRDGGGGGGGGGAESKHGK